MIKFIQKYQKFFYAVITSIIVISFSFFGTAGTIGSAAIHEQIAFKSVGGDKVTRGELESMVAFLQTDSYDQRLWGAKMGANFLNDGVIAKDFLETGMAEILAKQYPDVLNNDLLIRLEREKRYTPYVHPKAPFLSAEMVWNYFSPTMKQNLDTLQKSHDPLSDESLKARINLYLAERQFPSPYLTEVLRRQESQYGWVEKDPGLRNRDFSLFSYHNLDDWFGAKFSRLVAEFIYNAADVAEQKGYVVTQAEAWADLVKNASASYKELSKSPDFYFSSQSQYLNEQLRQMGMDSGKATKIWQKVMLFRRVFHDVANSQFIEPKTLMLSNTWASESVSGDFYRLPEALRFSDLMNMAEFELYLANTSKEDKKLPLPNEPLAVEEVAKKSPELVEKRYLAVIKKADKKGLEGRVSMKETLAWETDPENFAALKKEFADLGILNGATLDKRVAALDSLPDTIRLKVDAYARSKIVAKHPEWLEDSLNQSASNAEVLSVRLKGGKEPLPGLKDRKALMDLLDKAKLGEEFTLNGDMAVYKIQVIDRSPKLEILSFKDARESGILAEMLNEKLNPLYLEVRNDKFKREGGEVKPFTEVKREVAEIWLAQKLKDIKTDAEASLKTKAPSTMIPDIAATMRFTGWADKVKNSPHKDLYVSSDVPAEIDSNKLPPLAAWNEQFKWIREKKKVSRSSDEGLFEKDKLYALKKGETSPLITPSNGDLMFIAIEDRKSEPSADLLAKETIGLRSEIGSEAERAYMRALVAKLKAAGAISFDYLQFNNDEVIVPENSGNQDV